MDLYTLRDELILPNGREDGLPDRGGKAMLLDTPDDKKISSTIL